MNQRIKIAIDTRDLELATTGTKTYLEELIKAIEKIQKKDFELLKIKSIWKPYWGHSMFGKVYEHIQFLIWKQFSLPIIAWIKKADVLICTDYYLPLLKIKAKHIVVFHDALFFDHPEYYNPLWLKWFKFWALKAAHKADGIIVPSTFSKNRLTEHLPELSNKLNVIYQGPKSIAASKRPSQKTTDILKRLENENIILHVGGLEKRKNLTLLIKAASIAHKKLAFKILFVGRPNPKLFNNSESEILECIEKNNMQDDVFFTGYVPDGDLPHIYKKAKAYIIPSRYEGFGIPILEAFQHHVPVAVADNTSMPEIGGEAVLTFSPNNEEVLAEFINNILLNDTLRNDLIEKGTERLKSFSWDISAHEILALISNLHKKN